VKLIICTVVTALSVIPATSSAQNSMHDLRRELTSSPQISTPSYDLGTQIRAAGKKSQATAVLYSLLLPGMGEWYAGDFGTGRYSLGTEAALWLTYISFQQYGNWIQGDARAYAATHAGASIGGKDDQFFVNIGNFSSVYDYNNKKLQDRNLDAVYDPSQGYFWNWDTDADRQSFKALRISSDKVLNNSRFVIAAIIVNHIVSAVDAARLVRRYNRNIDESIGSFQLGPDNVGGQLEGIRLTYVRRF